MTRTLRQVPGKYEKAREALLIKRSQGSSINKHFFRHSAEILSNPGAAENLTRRIVRRSSSLVMASCSTGPGGWCVAQDESGSSSGCLDDAGGSAEKKTLAKAAAFSWSVDAVPLSVFRSSTPGSPEGRVTLR